MKLSKYIALVCFVGLAGCAADYRPLQLERSGNAVILRGEIDGRSQQLLESFLSQNEDITTLVLQNIGGSVDDEANLQFGRAVRSLGLNTRVPANGMVASGGTDLFLAGVERRLDPGACVGVHEWATYASTASDLSRDDPVHDEYLVYYDDIGIDRAFYWFTLEAAPAESMYWMTAQDAERFGLSTSRTPQLGAASSCDAR
ncbi:MAG: alpha/beta hydrolase [Pseudomonadota bacterium]